MSSGTNRTYPSNSAEQLNVAATVVGIDKAELVRGVHLGLEEPNGVGLPEDFEDYLPIHRIDNPADGINDGAKYVVYFQKEVAGAIKFYKAVNADPATLAELTSGPEYDLANSRVQ